MKSFRSFALVCLLVASASAGVIPIPREEPPPCQPTVDRPCPEDGGTSSTQGDDGEGFASLSSILSALLGIL